jgi:alpha-1,3-rhamnosyltransferase
LKKLNQSLVSIVIVTYNSSKFAIETLESVKSQTWENIELIISDDCSSDNTIELCRSWISLNKGRFVRTDIITVPENTGVSANCNRCIKASNAAWIKFIAGDDILLPNCIADNMHFVKGNPDAQILFSQIKVYQDTFEPENYKETTPAQFPNNLFHPTFDAIKQFQILCECDRIHFTPSYMFHKDALEKVGFYDESERLVEDYPMWLRLTKAGIRLHYFHTPTVGYRIHANATNNTGDDVLFKPSVINGFKVRQVYAHPHLPRLVVKQETSSYYVTIIFMKLGINKASPWNNFLYKMGTIYFNPFFWVHAVSKRIKWESK